MINMGPSHEAADYAAAYPAYAYNVLLILATGRGPPTERSASSGQVACCLAYVMTS